MKSTIFGWHLGQHVSVNAARSLCAPIHESYIAFSLQVRFSTIQET